MTRGTIKRASIALLVVTGMTIGVGACGVSKAQEPFKDAPKSDVRNNEPADIIEMPDGFSNLAAKCDGPNRVYVIFKGDDNRGAVAVVANDPSCTRRDG